MTKKTVVLALSVLTAANLLTGCATGDDSALSYTQNQTRQAQSVQLGKVVSVQKVKREGDSNDLISLGGAALGGLGASTIGGGRGSIAAGLAGALAAGYGTQALQKKLNTKDAFEVTVQLDSGRTISIVQDTDVQLQVGQRVRVLSGGGTDRVVPAN